MTDWDRHYSRLDPLPPEPEPTHWLWGLVGTMLGMVALSLVFAWVIEYQNNLKTRPCD